MLVARLASRLLYFLFIVATRERVALIVLAAVVPPVRWASSGGATNQRGSPWRLDLEGIFQVEDT
jgi:hypothetical protein